MKNKKPIQICLALFLLFISMAVLAQGAVPFESLVQKDASGPQVPFASLAQSYQAENAAKELSNAEEAAKNPSLSWIYVAFPIFIVAGMLTYIEVKRKNDHIKLVSQSKQNKADSLRNYVGTNLRKGYTKEQITNALAKNNYNSQEIQEAFRGIR